MASAEAFVGWPNKRQGIEDDHDLSFSYGVEIKENLRETKGDLPADHLPAASRRQLASMLSIARFWSMRRPVRSLVYLFWISSFVSGAVAASTQIYIYQVFTSVGLNIVAGIAMFTGCMIGFCVYGAIVAQCRLNAKHGFPLSFIVTGLGLIFLPLAHDVTEACAAATVRGIGLGLFWLTIHTYELMETRDHERDVYSTFASTGDQIVTVASAAFATLLIWLSHNLGAGDFTLLFFVTPPIFLFGLPSIGALPDYRPEPIKKHDLVHFLTDRHNQAAQIYLM
ncbi:MAG TPA: MFS transporter, partial [Rhodomicrobium sp.]|nr:MFS transporter [Rhodomicrobium sp.]